jgi:hypothetical protein
VAIIYQHLGRYRVAINKNVRAKRSEANPTGWETVEATSDLPYIESNDLFGEELYGMTVKKGLSSLKHDNGKGPNGETRYSVFDRDTKKLIAISAERQAHADAAKAIKDELNAIIAEIPVDIANERKAARRTYHQGFNEGGDGYNPYDDYDCDCLASGSIDLLRCRRPDLADRLTGWKQANRSF